MSRDWRWPALSREESLKRGWILSVRRAGDEWEALFDGISHWLGQGQTVEDAVRDGFFGALANLETDGPDLTYEPPRGSDSAVIGPSVAANEAPVGSDLLEKQG